MPNNNQKITTYKADGLFKAAGVVLQKVTDTAAYTTLEADISDCQDSVIALVNIPTGVTAKIMLSFLGNDTYSDKDTEVTLENGKLNVIHFTTQGIKRADGTAKFFMSSNNTSGLASHNITIAFLRYTPVINH